MIAKLIAALILAALGFVLIIMMVPALPGWAYWPMLALLSAVVGEAFARAAERQ